MVRITRVDHSAGREHYVNPNPVDVYKQFEFKISEITELYTFPKRASYKKMDKTSYNAGVAKGQTQEKASNLMDKAGGAAQTAQKSVMNAGQTIQQKAVGATDAVMKATGMGK